MNLATLRTAALGLTCALVTACAGPSAGVGPGKAERTASSPPADPPAAVLARFVDALEAGRWEQATGLLSARWRSAYTPSRLQADFAGAGALGREAVSRVQGAVRQGTPLQIGDGRATLALASGRALLVAEEGGWRVDALE